MLLLSLLACERGPISADTTPTDTTPTAPLAAGALLSAYFGLDDDLPVVASRICEGAFGADGMPIIFDAEVDVETLQAGDIMVVTRSGRRLTVDCVTLAPALDVGELRTALLIGNLGSESDPPVSVEVTGHVRSLDGSRDYVGAAVAVTPLADGPRLVLAEIVPRSDWHLGEAPARGAYGTRCPEGTAAVVRAVWAGGVTKPGGADADDAEGALYTVTLDQGGERVTTRPAHLADLGDGDNNHLLCLSQTDRPVEVSFPAGHLTDPRDDPNPATSITIR